MSRKYKFRDNSKLYFISYSVVNWIDLFVRNEYRHELIDSWKYCQKEKGLEIYAWCIMTSHVHMIVGSETNSLASIIRDMKTHTSKQLKKCIQQNQEESRREWILEMMQQAGSKNSNNDQFQLWQQHNHPIELNTTAMFDQKLDYIHQNPVEAGFVGEPEDWLFSSAGDYAGRKGPIDIIFG